MNAAQRWNPIRTITALAAALLLAQVLATPSGATVPMQVNFQGLLLDDEGDPITGNVDMTFTLFDADVGGVLLWSENHSNVAALDGVYDASLGSMTPLSPGLLASGSLYLEIEVDGQVLTPRQRLLAVPYALRASFAETAPDGAITGDGQIDFPELVVDELQYTNHIIGSEILGEETPWYTRWGCTEAGRDQPNCVWGYGFNLDDIGAGRTNGWTYGMRHAKEQSYIDDGTGHIMWAEENREIQYPSVLLGATNVSGGSFTAGNYIVLGPDPGDLTHGSAYIEAVDGNQLHLLWQQRDAVDPFQGELITEVASFNDPLGTQTGVTAQFPDPATVSFPSTRQRYFSWIATMDRKKMVWAYFPRDDVVALRFGKFSNGKQGVVIGTNDMLPVDNGLLVEGVVRLKDALEFRASDGKRIAIRRPPNGLASNLNLELPITANNSTLVARQGGASHGISVGAISDGGAVDTGDEVCASLDAGSACLFVLEFSSVGEPTATSCAASHDAGVRFLATCN